MVIIEFFSNSPIDNMISTFTNRPETVVFLGDTSIMQKWDPVFRRFLASVGNTQTQLLYRNTKRRSLHSLVRILEGLVEEFPGCHFDITGGDPTVLAAVGVIFERCRSQGIQLHRYSIPAGKVCDCDLDGISVSGDIPLMTVEQNIILHGGSVDTGKKQNRWDMSEEAIRDIFAMWAVCASDCARWNSRIAMLNNLRPYAAATDDELLLSVPLSGDNPRLPVIRLDGIIAKLEKAGLISDVSLTGDRFSLRYKNFQVKQLLEKAGNILELYTCAAARSLRCKSGKPYYHHSRTGVSTDWDGKTHGQHSGKVDTKNEIDVLLMRGAAPVFISCKNGAVAEEELYKLNAVANRFGGRYAKKVLVATTLGKRTQKSRQYFLERAKDMGITVITDVHKLSPEDFSKRLRLRW